MSIAWLLNDSKIKQLIMMLGFIFMSHLNVMKLNGLDFSDA